MAYFMKTIIFVLFLTSSLTLCSSHGLQSLSSSPLKPKNTKATIEILEPPDGSFIKGGNFYVKANINPENKAEFVAALQSPHRRRSDTKICFSLDDGPWYCWSAVGGRVFYSEATEGMHTLVGRLYMDGRLREESSSQLVTFTTVVDDLISTVTTTVKKDPPLAESLLPGDDVVETEARTRRTNDVKTTTSSQTEDEQQISVASTADDASSSHQNRPVETTTSSHTPNEQQEQQQPPPSSSSSSSIPPSLTIPTVSIISPAETDNHYEKNQPLVIKTNILVENDNYPLFERYFRYAFGCVTIDAATAYACQVIFVEDESSTEDMMVLGLDVGLHTIEAALSHPESGDLISESRSREERVFYIT